MFKYALAPYIKAPEKHPDTVVFQDEDVVIIRDAFPKSCFHYLILPRSAKKTRQLPTLVFRDLTFKAEISKYVEICTDILVKEFESKYEVKEGSDIKIRDFVQVGCHSVPSLSNLHIHVLTKDFHSARLKNKKHYNSFNTDFFIPFDQLPLKGSTKFDEPRFDAEKMEKLCKTTGLKCCYCEAPFDNKFRQLKNHLDQEFEKNFREKQHLLA